MISIQPYISFLNPSHLIVRKSKSKEGERDAIFDPIAFEFIQWKCIPRPRLEAKKPKSL